MNVYKITFAGNELMKFLDNLPLKTKIEIEVTGALFPSDSADDELSLSIPMMERKRATRTPRGSRVNKTILAALANGPQTTKQLKEALEAADLAPGSLSTGLAALQKSGEVSGHGGGIYAISYEGQKAAAQ